MREWKHWDSHLHIHPFKPEWWVDRLVKNMDRNGVEGGAISGVGLFTPEEDEHTQAAAARHPGRFLPMLCNVDFNDPRELGRVVGELETGRWAGVGEVFLNTFVATHMTFVKDGQPVRVPYPAPKDGAKNAVLGELLRYCTAQGLPMLLHCETASVLEDLLRRCPESTVIWAHCDYATPPPEVRRILETYPWLHADLGPMIRCGYWDTQHGASNWLGEYREFWRDICRDFADRLMLGTDTAHEKYCDADRYRHIYDSYADFFAPLDAGSVEKITGGNLRRAARKYLERR